ncbi:MAG: hypothetical protein LAT64_14405 [Phycisphaerales bacterium]|nr:hypothetical protein [Planctomycetota bacterium]MCH8509941.1 hypothetical protein [Phycisphaerales bacterium]
MGSTARVVVWSGILAATSFAGVLIFAPVDVPRLGMTAVTRDTTVDRQAARIRRALADGRTMAALSIGNQTVELFPEDPAAWLWKTQAQYVAGHINEARATGERIEQMAAQAPTPDNPLAGAALAYQLGWARFVQGDRPASRERFLEAAGLYEPASVGVVDEALRLYNMACYLAMGGEIDRAAEQFALAVGAGYGGDAGWWRVDPDLEAIREHRVYLDASVVLQRAEEELESELREQREQAARREREERREGEEGDAPANARPETTPDPVPERTDTPPGDGG